MGTPGKPGTVSGGLCVCLADRIYAATPMGIQPVISFGIADAILTLPEEYVIEEWLASNVCRCTSYEEIRAAVGRLYPPEDAP